MDRRELLKKLVGVLPGVALTAMVLPAWARPAPARVLWGGTQHTLAENVDYFLRLRAQDAVGKDLQSIEMQVGVLEYVADIRKMMGKEYVSFGYGMITSSGRKCTIVEGIHWQVDGEAPGNVYDPKYWAVTDDGHWYMKGTPPHLIGA